jgi:hypothetical protein
MSENAKIKRLSELSEKQLRETLLVPLLARLGYKAVTVYHGPQERGKDIICYRQDQLGDREYLAVVAKAADLNGAVSSSDGLREVLHQVLQCFDVPYEDLFGVTRVRMNRVWVVTSRRIISGAQASIFDGLQKNNLDKVTRFISGERLIELLDEYYPAFGDAALEPADILQEQKARLTHFCRRILVALGGGERDIDETLNQVIHGYSVPPVTVPAARELSHLSPYRVEIDTIEEPFAHDFHTTACGSIREAFFKTKKLLYHAMFDVDEVMIHYDHAMEKTDPEKFVEEYNDGLGKDSPFGGASWGTAGEAVRAIGMLEQGLDEFQELMAGLKAVNKLGWATGLVDSVAKLEPDIASFLEHVEKETFSLFWQIEGETGDPSLRLVFDGPLPGKQTVFTTEHSKSVTESYDWNRTRNRPITVKDITAAVQEKIREHLDKMVPSKPETDE